jgi:capsular polysaccharide biosynthesis protein
MEHALNGGDNSPFMMPRLNRLVHDASSGLATRFGVPLTVHHHAPSPGTVVQKAGSRDVDNTLENALHTFLPRQIQLNWNEGRLWEIDHAWLAGEEANVFLPDGSLLSVCPSLRHHPLRKIRRPIKAFARRMEGPVFSLAGRNDDNHGHFILQHLPRLLAALPLLQKYPDYRILLGSRIRGWQLRYLQALGIEPERCVPGSSGTLLVDKLIYVPQLWSDRCFSDPDHCRLLGDAFLSWAQRTEKCAPSNPEQPPLFISRADAPNRVLLNEDALVEEVRRQCGACELLVLSQTPFEQQIRKFSRAPLIIGGLGQGFVNLLVARRSLCVIIDMVPSWSETPFSDAFRDIALLQGNHASRIYLGSELSKTANWHYPIDRFAEELQRLLQHHRTLHPAP